MASTAKVLSSLQPLQASRSVPRLRAVTAPRARDRAGWLLLLRESIGGALLLAAVIALWTVTWAAVAGPLSPVAASGSAQAASVERR